MDTIIQILQNYGFERSTAKIYKLLVQSGESSVSDLIEMSELSRGGIYDAISSLQEKNLVQHRKDGRQALYKAENPDKLHYLKQEKENEVEQMNAQLESIIGQMKGEYNLAESKPGVRFFEGKEGFREALWDTLNAEEEIYTFGAMEKFPTEIKQINSEYVKQREEREINKKILFAKDKKTTEYKKNNESEFTEIGLLPEELQPFSSSLQIYNNKISYFSFEAKNMVATIVEDKNIHEMNKNLFQFLWKKHADTTKIHRTTKEKMEEDIEK